ncbi:MAG TPA: YitT family protein [Bacilli bacterium]|nr:YitT family protein [Bacilli bacterium]HOD60572.1 YitT family protein [Bacilli bacterium]HOH61862.1 YitT family protein [Bacilli bacterium]HPB49362.1 YitT family protein [Bacilli bacterium]HPM14526.1 YitT family protein [Bacilli bacterium]
MKALFTKKRILEFIYITCGVAIASFAFSFFLNPNNIVIGGISGISIIIKDLTGGYNPATMILILNVVLLLIGLVFLGKDFFIKTAYGSIMFPVFIWLFDFIYQIIAIDFSQMDMILVIVFSAIIMGSGLGIVVKHGGTTGGTEIPQKILFKYFHLPYSISLYILDGTVILLGFILMEQKIDFVFYEIIFMFICGFAMDLVIFSGFNKRAVYIISEKAEEIREELLTNFDRGVTGIKVIGEYSQSEKKMLLCVLSTLEYYKLRDFIGKIDKNAFFYAVRASEVRGEGFSYVKED